MVLNEGDRPVSQEDVWMRDGEGRLSTDETLRPRGLLDSLTAEQDHGMRETSDEPGDRSRRVRVIG